MQSISRATYIHNAASPRIPTSLALRRQSRDKITTAPDLGCSDLFHAPGMTSRRPAGCVAWHRADWPSVQATRRSDTRIQCGDGYVE